MSRAPLTLSREMRIVLIALGMLALLGGWLLMNNRRAANEMAVNPPPVSTPAPTPAPTGQTGAGAAGGTTRENTAPTTVQPANPAAPVTGSTEVVTAPPFPVTDAAGGTPDPSLPAPTPSGINPNETLLSLNGHNPFRPIKLDAKTNGTATSGLSANQNEPVTPPVTITQPTSTPAQIGGALANSGSTSGAFPVAPVPGTTSVAAPTIPTRGSKTTQAPSAAQGGGVIPITPIPGTPGSGAATVPSHTVTVPGSKGSGASTAQVPTPPAPPVAGVREPSVTVPEGAATNSTEAPAQAGVTNPATLPAPTNPQAITETQTAAGQTSTSEASSVVDTYVKDHQLVFDAAVLGPVNTAILRSDRGFVVATVGQTLPDSNVILKEVTATSATLSLGQDKTTLQLNKR